MLGLIGGPLICITGIAVVLGWMEASAPVQGIATIPEFFWELSLGIYLTVKGFKPSPLFTERGRRPGHSRPCTRLEETRSTTRRSAGLLFIAL